MKKRILLLLLIVSINAIAQKNNAIAQKKEKEPYADRKATYEYSENVNFSIFAITKKRTIDRGGGNFRDIIKAEKGRKFVSIIFKFKNESSETQEIDFSKIFIKDKQGELHKIDFVVMAMKLTGTFSNLKQKLKKKKKKIIATEFRPSFDENEIIDELVVDGKLIKLEYISR